MKRALLFLLAIVIIIAAPHFIKQQFSFMSVTGISMTPALEEGDLVIYERISPHDVKVGDIIIYNIPSLNKRYFDSPPAVAHRVVEIRETATGLLYRTRGDNNPAQDPWSVRQCDIMGKVSQRISYLGFPLHFFKSRLGMVVIVLLFITSALCFYADVLNKIRRKVPMKLFINIIIYTCSKSIQRIFTNQQVAV